MPRRKPASIRITHRSSGEVIAEGPVGFWGITPFEGNFYISRKYLKTSRLKPNWIPGLCIYKFLYVWLDLRLPDGTREPSIGWMYWLPTRCFRSSRFGRPSPNRRRRCWFKKPRERGSRRTSGPREDAFPSRRRTTPCLSSPTTQSP
jgi:hypothetical protein